jgi:hypothetical protein
MATHVDRRGMVSADKKKARQGRANGGLAHIGKGPVHHAPRTNLTTPQIARNRLIPLRAESANEAGVMSEKHDWIIEMASFQ